MPVNYTMEEASSELGIPLKYLENYVKVGCELNRVRIGRRKLIPSGELERWKTQRDFTHVTLDHSDYFNCLEFAIRSFYSYHSTADFGTSTQRDAGKFVSNFVLGKLGEIAVSKFLRSKFDLEIRLDFEIREGVIGQDITELARPRVGVRVFNPLQRRVAIKTSKMKNVWLIIPENEVLDAQRTSDIYIYSRVDLYLDHLLRLLRDLEPLQTISDMIPEFETIEAEVCGFTFKDALPAEPVTRLPAPDQKIGSSFIMKSGDLLKSEIRWQEMLATL